MGLPRRFIFIVGCGLGAGAAGVQVGGGEELRWEARKLEGDVDMKLSSYTRLARDELDALGVRFRHLVVHTSIVAMLDTGRPPVVALRTYMDALPIQDGIGKSNGGKKREDHHRMWWYRSQLKQEVKKFLRQLEEEVDLH